MRQIIIPPVVIPVQTITGKWPAYAGLNIAVLRTDLVDVLLSGNKYFKLKYNLLEAAAQGQHRLLSFGGCWSNHLHALAAAGQRYGFSTTGVIRGEAPAELNACLREARAMGMELHFVSRSEYCQKEGKGSDRVFLEQLTQRFGPCYLIPEGGANFAGIRGCQELLGAAQSHGAQTSDYSHILLACGTGTTMAGLVTSTTIPVTGIQVLKGQGYLQNALNKLLNEHQLQASAAWYIRDEFHRGGYARGDNDLLDFTARFARSTGVPLEPVYSGKLFAAIETLLADGTLGPDDNVLVVHGGGLQGARGWAADGARSRQLAGC